MDIHNCLLLVDEDGLYITFEEKGRKEIIRDPKRHVTKRGGKWYVSFYYDSYRHWANYVSLETPFTAKRTKDYQYVTHNRPAQQARLDRVIRSTRNSHAKSLY